MSGLNLMTFHNVPIPGQVPEILAREEYIDENIQWVDLREQNWQGLEAEPLPESSSLYFISDVIYEQVFREFVQLALGSGEFNNMVVPNGHECVGQDSGGYNYRVIDSDG